jgi:hypothetical protein
LQALLDVLDAIAGSSVGLVDNVPVWPSIGRRSGGRSGAIVIVVVIPIGRGLTLNDPIFSASARTDVT